MLTRFTVGNFRSFDKNQTLSLIASSKQKHKERLFQANDMKLLKFSALFGANAAGKSNFIKAMEFVQRVVYSGTESHFFDENKDSYYRLNPANKDKASYFEFEFCIKGTIYAYGFEIILSKKQITEEWLIQLGKERNDELFTRNTQIGQFTFDNELLDDPFEKRMQIYFEDFKNVQNKLFIKNIVMDKDDLYKNNQKLKILQEVFAWLFNLNISYPRTSISGYDCFSSENIPLLLNAITSFKTGISKINQTEITKEQALDKTNMEFKKDVDEAIRRTCNPNCTKDQSECKNCGFRMNCNGRLVFVTFKDKEPVFTEITFEHYNIPDIEFSLAEESDGTQRLLDLLSVLFNQKENSVFVIDEIDRSLHPQLTMHFIQTFLKLAEKRNIQLFVTTHESHLLDLDILRQDEIFFTKINKQGASVLYPFDRFKERFDKKIEKAYLDGRYGASPLFDRFFSPFDSED
jgi:AAA15 family ATPase/GTPase